MNQDEQDEILEDTTSMEEKLETLENCEVSTLYSKDNDKTLHFYCEYCDKEMGYNQVRKCSAKDTQKSERFTGEFGIHFSESELLFVPEFIATEKHLSYEEGLNENWGGDREIQLKNAQKEGYGQGRLDEREEVKKELLWKLPKLKNHICRFNDGKQKCDCFNECLSDIKIIINNI